MAVSLTRFSWWYWSGKEKDAVSNGSSSLNKSCSDSVKGARMASSSSSTKREKRRREKEYDVVVVPSDGLSDDSDWSIGWLEPHAPDFQSDDELDNSFAVLVPCYRNDCQVLKELNHPKNHFLSAISNLPDHYSAEGNKYMDQWLSSLQNF